MSHVIDQSNVPVALPEAATATGHYPEAAHSCTLLRGNYPVLPHTMLYEVPMKHISKKSTSCSVILLQNSLKPAFHKDLKLVVK